MGPDAALSDAELDAVVSTVKAEWRDAYPSADFSGLSARVADLSDLQLGSEGGGGITIDVDAAGWGWGSGGMSLKTAVRHELGHYLGLGHSLRPDGLHAEPRRELGRRRLQPPEAGARARPRARPGACTRAGPGAPTTDSTTADSTTGSTATDTTRTATAATAADATTTSAPTGSDPATTSDPAADPTEDPERFGPGGRPGHGHDGGGDRGPLGRPDSDPAADPTSEPADDPATAADPLTDPVPVPDVSSTPIPPAPTAADAPASGTGGTTTTTTTGQSGTTTSPAAASPTASSTTQANAGAATPAAAGLAWIAVDGVLTLGAGTLTLVGTITYDGGARTVTFTAAGGGAAVVGSTVNITLVRVVGGAGNDDLLIDVRGSGVVLAFDGGGGSNTVRGPPTDTAWTISGRDAGSFGSISFSRVGHLVGAADTKDTFTLGAQGSLSAGLDGGARGFDSLVVTGRRGVISTTAVDPSTGTLKIDGTVLRYTGLEPIAIIGTEVHVTGTAGNDTIHVSVSGTTLSVSSPTIETLNLATPGLTKLVIDGLGGVDSVTFDTDLLLPGMVLDVTAETITVGAVVINTTGGPSNGAVHLRAVATADGAGAATITTAPGATISLTGATIRSGSISIDASASSTVTTTSPIAQVTITSTATVTIKDSTLVSSGDIHVSSTSTVTADLQAGALASNTDPASNAAYAQLDVTTTAITSLTGTTRFARRR